ncbi:phosphatidylinositol N-acetylglucosaminyltransferase subunit C [Lentinula edodes]|uniref:Phosphatidylinositol N-acetylglucosaminyltransferase n=1 Tax=Lentinula edodes TaxID=5353 RepID=A0A1Q3E929_LENED|nr:phosphatidylinositol N-acetylglucosaminyltransferase subunit C [Lentinula edodes]KAH7880700.1 phosphatidylinositol N-acetylglucosaminyltransferase subunit C [Lentinula edodes]KAJ3902099.1 phosphatidylinositol N-acetylglucosaminyltransferase subunit C [Lentinula edodes]GAW03681.1 phosphatidylinositol N-acetylglucosaminyltransferase [Lentinula edodes]
MSPVTPPWEKVLWKKQPYPDNYIPEGALDSSLRKNPNFKPYTYWPLVHLSTAITQHLATIFIFLCVFVRLKDHSLDPRVLIFLSLGCFFLGYLVWEVLQYTQNLGGSNHGNERNERIRLDRVKTFKSSILIFLALMSLSPVLRTLSAATSSDSIWALSACLFLLNILLADYGSSNPVIQGRHERLTSVLSMNAAISSSVVLASRLTNDLAVFALIQFSVQSFTLFPMLRRRLQAFSDKKPSTQAMQTLLTLILSISSFLLAIPLSSTIAFLVLFVLLAVTMLAPAVLVWAQKYKNEIRGPWDVAVPKLN